MDELDLYEKILSLSPPWFVSHVQLDEASNTVHVHVEYDADIPVRCPSCNSACIRYDHRRRSWRHLDTCQFQTIVHCDVPRCQCEVHGVLQVEVPWAEKGSRFTLLFESLILDWLKEASINAVSRRLGLSWNAIDGVMKRAVARGLARRSSFDMEHLAVDEISQRKGHSYVTIVSNHLGHVLDIQDNRSTESLGTIYSSLDEASLQTIKSISMDMSPAYISATLAWIPDARTKICFDKFHVAQDLNKAVDATRKSEMRTIDPLWRKDLHRSKFAWLRNQDRLTNAHHEKISALKTVAIRTARAWSIRQYAMDLWDYSRRGWAEKAWLSWYGWAIRSRLKPIKTVARSIKKNLWGILNAIVLKQNNARAESINSKIKQLKVRARGFRNKDRFKTAILFHLGGLCLKH